MRFIQKDLPDREVFLVCDLEIACASRLISRPQGVDLEEGALLTNTKRADGLPTHPVDALKESLHQGEDVMDYDSLTLFAQCGDPWLDRALGDPYGEAARILAQKR